MRISVPRNHQFWELKSVHLKLQELSWLKLLIWIELGIGALYRGFLSGSKSRTSLEKGYFFSCFTPRPVVLKSHKTSFTQKLPLKNSATNRKKKSGINERYISEIPNIPSNSKILGSKKNMLRILQSLFIWSRSWETKEWTKWSTGTQFCLSWQHSVIAMATPSWTAVKEMRSTW